ncbi:pyridoxal-phosphate dependent enzyme [Streptomyces sp. P9-2B-2]|uniref:pyridoxal-phosphate dependent enzyme n=1 Tax=unclassified Streptomyces TaxID=2593676 RepID=UPI002001DB15|nr:MULTISPECIES: pyridoxal-phosphate dependent enzyme [unclassified Streptomyces]WJY42189.1 pyridoxal-phosphate dependent enzyme [Streptomyces sp. P9-2B-2]
MPLIPVGVAAAVAAGADTVVAASSGNAGAAAAAYAARAGLHCVVFTNEAVPAGLRAQIGRGPAPGAVVRRGGRRGTYGGPYSGALVVAVGTATGLKGLVR